MSMPRRVRAAGLWRAVLVATATACLPGCGASLNNEGANALSSAPGADLGTGPVGVTAASPTPKAPSPASTAAAAPAPGTSAPAPRPTDSNNTSAASANPSAGYKIGAQDVLEISVFKVPELSKSVQVADTGTVNLPLVGEMKAAGRTAQEVERELTQKLGSKYLQSPQVSVYVKEYNSQRVTVDGAVKKPGVFPYRSSVSLLQVIAMADGLDANSDSTVVVFRDVGGQRQAARFDISDIRNGGAADPPIKPGDVVVVGTSAVKEAFNNVLKALPLAGLFVGL